MNIICFGDSITDAGASAEGDRWPTVLQFRLNARDIGAYSVYNRGIGGHTSAQGLDRFAEHVLPLLPGLVLVEFGFNDGHIKDGTIIPRVSVSEYTRNLREIHRLITEKGGQCVFIINHSPRAQWDGTESEYNAAERTLASELAAPSVDLPLGIRKKGITPAEFVTEDGVHLTPAGNHRYAELVYEAVEALL